ncbi:MAG TPA: tetratricopeptide repeat protein [Pirellulales bacterium]|jgi:hypothetical protein|nr:tetratricopeptide repeat protein [Pirellulales bacterium]
MRSDGWFAVVPVLLASLAANAEAQSPSLRNELPPTGFSPYRPVMPNPFGPYDLLGGFARAAITAPQPSGHTITPTGLNGYVYQPTYDWPERTDSSQSPLIGPGAMPGTIAKIGQPASVAGLPPLPTPLAPAALAPAAAPTASVAASRDMSVGDMLDAAIETLRSGQYAAAARWADEATTADAQQGLAYLVEMHACFALERYTDAADALRRATAVLPQSQWGAILDRYREYYQATRYTDHLVALERWVIDHPRDEAAQLLLGYHAVFLGQVPAGIEHLRRAVELLPSDGAAVALLTMFAGAPVAPADSAASAVPREF